MTRLRELRKQYGLTMKQLGGMVGVSDATISNYENGKRQPSNRMLKALAEFFGVTTDYLLDDEEAPEKSVENKALPAAARKSSRLSDAVGKRGMGLAMHFAKGTPYDQMTEEQKRIVYDFAMGVLKDYEEEMNGD